MHKYELILFDLDGTVADTDQMIVDTMNALYDKYRDGRRTPIEEIYYFSGPPIYDTLKKEFPHMDQDFMLEEFRKESTRIYPLTVKPYPHTKETLIKLKEEGFKLGIVTNKIHSSTLFCMDLIGLNGLFGCYVCYDDIINHKPHEEGIYKSMKELNVCDLSKVLYIGDNKIDLETADNAGVDCVLVTWGPRVIDENLKPKYKVSSYEELERMLLNE